MASIQTDINETKLCLTIEKISELKTLHSSSVTLQSLPWKITVFKSLKENTLVLRLVCMGSDEANWSCAATALLELKSFKPNYGSLKDTIPPYVFGANESSTPRSLIKWNELVDMNAGYVQSDTIKIDVKIMATNLKLNNKTELRIVPENDKIKAYLTIHEASTLIAASSDEFLLGGLSWRIIVIGVGYRPIEKTKFSSMLWCASKNTPSKWSREFLGNVSFLMENQQPNSKGLKKLLKFNEQCTKRYFPDSFLWSDLMNKFITRSGAIALEVELTEQNRELSEPQVEQALGLQQRDANGSHRSTVRPTELPCTICFESMVDRHIVNTECGHMFCKTCITTWIVERPHCPLCDKTLTLQQIHQIYLP